MEKQHKIIPHKQKPKKDRRAYMWKYRNKNRDVPEHFGKSSDHNPRP